MITQLAILAGIITVVQAGCTQAIMNLQSLNQNYQYFSNEIEINQEVSFSFWFKYEPKLKIQTQYFEGSSIKVTSVASGKLLFRVYDKQAKLFRLFSYFDITNQNLQTMIINADENIYSTETFNLNFLEGIWQYKLYKITPSSNKIEHFVFNYVTQTLNINQNDFIIDQTIIQLSIGGYGYFSDYYQNQYFQAFPGLISQFNVQQGALDINNIQFQNDLTQCINAQLICNPTKQTLINGIQTSSTQVLKANFQLDNTFEFSGWYKLSINNNNQIYHMLEVRDQNITTFNIIDSRDQLLALQCIVQNGGINVQIQLTVQSYESNLYYSKPDQIIIASTVILVSQWHFITIIYDREQNSQTGIDVYFPSTQQWISKRFLNLILFFTGSDLYFYIGSNNKLSQYFSGKIGELTIKSCIQKPYINKLQCDTTCKDCNGPTQNYCTECETTDNRQLIQNMCVCNENYFQFALQKKCSQLKQNTFFSIQELKYEKTQCYYGQFMVNQGDSIYCIDCPFLQVGTTLYCGDCLENQQDWQSNLKCTYNYLLNDPLDDQSTYMKVEQDPQQYLMDINSGSINNCIGCSEICNDDDCQVYKYTNFGQSIKVRCKPNYYYKDGVCQQCDQYCSICQNNVCIQCLSNYYFNSILQQCLLDTSSSQQCGFKCINCTLKDGNNRCLKCTNNYKISDDGYNCESFEIANCLNEHNKQGLKSTIPYLFDPLNQIITQPFCSLCSTNNYDSVNNQCTTITSSTCSYFIDQNICLLGQDSLLVKNVCSDQCNLCIKDDPNLLKDICVQCKVGYYIDLLSGTCKVCPSNCKNCAFDIEFGNSDRVLIPLITFYQQGVLKQYLDSLLQITQNLFKLICLDCQDGYVLNDGKCINECPQNCDSCQTIDNQNVCVKCTTTIQPIQSDSNCLECSTDCLACSERTQEEILKINPLFDLSISTFKKYANKCYKPSQTKTKLSNQIILDCQTFENCLKSFSIQINAYCWLHEFEQESQNADEDFFIYQYYLGDLMAQFELNFLNQQFLEQLNFYSIQQLLFQIKLISSSGDCSFDDEKFILNQKFIKYIFNLQSVNIKFFSDNQLKLQIPNTLQLYNYSTVIFQNIIFFGNNQPHIIDLTSYYNQFELQILDCQYTTLNDLQENNALQFKTLNIQSLKIQNFKIINVKLFNVALFIFQVSSSAFIIDIKQLQILDVSLSNLSIIEIQNPQNLNFMIQLQNIDINAKFINSSLLQMKNQSSYQGAFNLQQFNLIDSSLFGISYLFNLKTYTTNFVDCIMQGNTFYNDTSFVYSIGFNLQNVKIINNLIYFGKFFTNYDENYDQIDLNLALVWKQITFQQITYFSYNQFIIIKNNSNIQITIEDFSIIENIANLNSLKASNLKQSLVYLYGNMLSMKKLKIIKKTGIIELFLQFNSINIINGEIKQNDGSQIIIQPSQTCLNNYYNTDAYTPIINILNTRETVIDNLSLQGLSVVNGYLIGIQEDDGIKITAKLQNIKIQDNNIFIDQQQISSGIIKFISNTESTLIFQYSEAMNNIMYSYSQDSNSFLGTVLMISNCFGSIQINNNRFINNQAINTTHSITYFYGSQISVKNNYYQNNNYDDLELIYNKIADSFPSDVYIEQIREIYKVISNGGNGFYYGDNILIQDCIFDSSTALFGGGIYIQTMNNGIININNCQFLNLKTDLTAKYEGKGGGLFIDGSLAEIKLSLVDCIFDNVMAKQFGGAIYITTSQKLNNIKINNLKLNNVISLMGSFYHVVFNNLDVSDFHVDNIVWTVDLSVMNQYFGKLQGFKSDYSSYIKQKGTLAYTQYGNIRLENFKILSNFYFGFISLSECIRCIIHNILICKPQNIYYNLFYFGNYNLYDKSYIVMNQIFIDTLTVYSYSSTTYCNSAMNLQLSSPYINCVQKPFLRRGIVSGISDDDSQNNADCNINLLVSYSLNAQGVTLMDVFQGYLVNGIQLSQILQIKSVTILASTYDYLDYTFDLAISIYSNKNKTIYISDVLSIENTGYEFMRIQTFSETQRLLQLTYSTVDSYAVYIQNLINHLGNFWVYSGFTLLNYQAMFYNYIITNNSQQASYLMESSNMQPFNIFFINSLVTDNKLQSKNLSNPLRISVNKVTPELIKSNSIFLFNYRSDQTELTNIAEFRAKRLRFKYDGLRYLRSVEKFRNDTMIIDEVYVKPFKAPGIQNYSKYLMLPSGQNFENYSYFDKLTETFIPLNINLSITLMNSQMEKMELYSGVVYVLSAKYRIMNESNPIENTNFTDLQQIKVTDISSSEKFIGDLIVDFNPYSDPSLYYQLSFSCNFVEILRYNSNFPYKMKDTISAYQLRVNIKTYKCQVGEYIYLNQCRQCDATQNYFQVLEGQSFCYLKDDVSTIQVKRYTVQMKPHYWRFVFNSTKIEYCYHQPTNCLGGWKYGDYTCIQGHIGALCEQCDLYNLRGDGSYSVSSQYNCGSCNDVRWNIIVIIIIGCLTLTFGVITVKSNYDDTQEFIVRTKLHGAFGISTSIRVMSTILIKMLTNYAQIISSIFTFQLTLPPEIQQSTNSVGNPTQSMVYSLDCFLIAVSELTIMYLEFIWMLATPFFFIFIIYFFYFFFILIKIAKFNVGVITTTLIYFYIYMQPNLIQNMISQLSRRSISGVEFVQGNVSYLYQTNTHHNWLILVIVPILITFGLLIPLSLWYQVYKNKNELEKAKVRQPWGFLYNEYKKEAYYWETIKLIQKQTIIIALNYYEDQVSIKASLVLLIVFIYHVLSNKINPYYVYKLNRLDTYCTVVCSISIILCSTIYSAQVGGQQEIVWPFYIITAAVNILYILDLVIQIIFSYLAQFQDLFDKVKTFITRNCKFLVDKYPYLQELLTTKQQKQKKIKERWGMIKEYLYKKASRTLKAKRYTLIHSPESYYQRRGGISSPSPIFTNRGGDAIKGDMIDSQSQLNGSINRKENMSNPTIKLVETVYQPKNEEIKRDEFQVEDDPLSPHIVYLSFNPKTISQLKE